MKRQLILMRQFAVAATFLVIGAAPVAQAQQIVQSRTEYVAQEVIVKLKGSAKSQQSRAFIGRMVSEKGMTLKGSWGGLNLHHFRVPESQSVADAVASLQADSAVQFAEPNYLVHKQSMDVEAVMSAEDFAAQSISGGVVHAETATNTTAQTAAAIGLGQAWNAMSAGKTAPIVAVIDTGIDFTHTVFTGSGAIWTNPKEIPRNGIDDDGNGFIDDVNGWNWVSNNNSPVDDDGHGTHVSGIILGTTQDITQNPIAAAQIRIMPLKFLDNTGSGSTSNAVSAIYYAVNNGAKVLSNSWGGTGYSATLLTAVTFAYTSGTVFVAAAGNSSSDNDTTPTYPANYNTPGMIAVAATSDSDTWATFSNWGPTTVNLSSPGVNIWSTYPLNAYARLSGTSMATPFVSGTAALMVREQPTMNGYQVQTLLLGGVNKVSGLSGLVSTSGRLNVYNALVAAQTATVSSALPAFSAASIRAPASASSSSGGGGCGLVASQAIINGDDHDDFGDGISGTSAKAVGFLVLMGVLVFPLALGLLLRTQARGAGRRRYTRYQIDSSVRVRIGDRELIGKVSTISLGGIQLDTDAWLDKGGVVRLVIASPDGKGEVAVEGKVVWSEEQKRYGVAFANADDSVLDSIRIWTKGLLRV